MHTARIILPALAALCLPISAIAQTVLIDPTTNNGSFEFAGGVLNTTKIQAWDTSPDIDNWVEWGGESTDATDSGVEMTGFASDGDMVAFLRGGNATFNITTHIVSEGDFFSFSWDHVRRPDRDHSVWLIYNDGGVITKIDDSLVETDAGNPEGTTYTGGYVVPAGSPAIGNPIGLGVHAFGAYPEIDNFFLDVGDQAPVPGDVDGDRDVDLDDFAEIRDNFLLSPATVAQGDLVGGDIVDLDDFLFWRSNNPTPTQPLTGGLTQGVPEPSSLLLALGALTVLLRGRK